MMGRADYMSGEIYIPFMYEGGKKMIYNKKKLNKKKFNKNHWQRFSCGLSQISIEWGTFLKRIVELRLKYIYNKMRLWNH